MTTLRKIKREEIAQYNQLASICFTYTIRPEHMDGKDMPQERLDEIVAVFDEESNMLGAMVQLDYDTWFEGARTKLLGIGGVVADPAFRRRGAIRQLFEEGLPRLRKAGYVFSALYPFSHVFYRKFGYEWCIMHRKGEFSPHSLRKNLRSAASIRRVLPEGPDHGMQKVYEAYMADKNLGIVRREDHWKGHRAGTPWSDLKHAYVLMDDSGEPMAYWTGAITKGEDGGVLAIKDMAYTSRKGCESIFAMLSTMNEVGTIRLTVPQDLELRYLVEDPYDVRESNECGGMVRVMDVERALAMLPAPVLPGTFTICVEDKQIEENNGTFTVVSDGYHLAVEKNNAQNCDVKCTINALSALVTGSLSYQEAVQAEAVEVWSRKNERLLAATFCKRKIHLHDFF